jgi:hypothetical protein
MYHWRTIWFTRTRLFCRLGTVCACVAFVRRGSTLDSITALPLPVGPAPLRTPLFNILLVAVNWASHSYSPHSDTCISSRGGFTQDEDTSESRTMAGILPVMVAFCNCAALRLGGIRVVPYPAPAYAVAGIFR